MCTLSARTHNKHTISVYIKCQDVQQTHNKSVRLHAQLNPIKAIARLCSAIGQLKLSSSTRWRVNRFISRSMSHPGAIGGAVPVYTSGSRATGWPLYVTTSNNKLTLRCSDLSLNIFLDTVIHIYISLFIILLHNILCTILSCTIPRFTDIFYGSFVNCYLISVLFFLIVVEKFLLRIPLYLPTCAMTIKAFYSILCSILHQVPGRTNTQ